MAVKNKGLGKGLGVLFGDAEEINRTESKSEEKTAEIYVKIGSVEPNRAQPRKNFDAEALNELAESIRIHGIIQPILVVKKGSRYQIVAGERRWRAAKIAGLKEVPVILRDYSEETLTEVALIENIQRKDLNPIEEAEAYRRLIEEYGLTQEGLAERMSKSRVNITNSLRLLKLPEEVRQMLIDGALSSGHAKVLLGIEDPDRLQRAARETVLRKLSVRDTEKLVKTLGKTRAEKKPLPNEVAYDETERLLCEKLGTRVRIVRKTKDSGKLEISFSSLEDFERIAEHIK